MALKQFTIDFSELAKEITLRFDVDFVDFNRVAKDKVIPFKELFDVELSEKTERLGLLNEIEDKDFYYCEIGNATKQGDLEPVKLNFEDRNELNENYFTKIEKGDIQRAFDGDILLSKVRPNLKKYILVDDEYGNYFFTTAFIRLRPKTLNKILYYSLRSIFYKNLMAVAREGKGYPTLKEDDLYYLKFDKNIIKKLESQQDAIVAQIEPIEKEIKQLKGQLKDPQEIINKVFAKQFGFDLEKFEEAKREKFFEVEFGKIVDYHSLRFDVKNQKYFGIFKRIISSFSSSYFLKKISKDNGQYGANEPAKDGEKGVDIRYIRITDIDSRGNLIDDDWKTAENIDEQYLLKNDDFLFARSGNTVGKTFLYDSKKHEEAIFAGYFIKFKLDFSNLDKMFFLYYTKSFIYDFWVKGIVRIKGQPNINANEYLELQIPDIPLSQQQKIVDEIKTELDEQERVKAKIQELRDKIDQIIEKAIQS